MPSLVRDNDWWREHHPQMVADAEKNALAKVWRAPDVNDPIGRHFDEAMGRFFQDPFLGARSRRWLAEGERSIDLEMKAAADVMSVCGLKAGDIDVALVGSFIPDEPHIGNAAYLGEQLGLRLAWNIETACNTPIAGIIQAQGLVASGFAKNVLVVTSCNYSRRLPVTHPMCWSNGDGAAALIVQAHPEGNIAGMAALSTPSTNGSVYYFDELDEGGSPVVRMAARPDAGKRIRDVSEPALQEAVGRVLEQAGWAAADVDVWAMNTPLAWYADFIAASLGIDRARVVNTHPTFANTGPVLAPTNLLYASALGRMRAGAKVVMYGIGSTASAGAVAFVADDFRGGPVPVALEALQSSI